MLGRAVAPVGSTVTTVGSTVTGLPLPEPTVGSTVTGLPLPEPTVGSTVAGLPLPEPAVGSTVTGPSLPDPPGPLGPPSDGAKTQTQPDSKPPIGGLPLPEPLGIPDPEPMGGFPLPDPPVVGPPLPDPPGAGPVDVNFTVALPMAALPFLTLRSKVKTPLSPSRLSFLAAPLHLLSQLPVALVTLLPFTRKAKSQVHFFLPTLTSSPVKMS